MHIGNRIKEVLVEEGKSVMWLSAHIGCERTNTYKILARRSLNVMLLQRISIALHHDFFQDLSDELHHLENEWLFLNRNPHTSHNFPTPPTIPTSLRNIWIILNLIFE